MKNDFKVSIVTSKEPKNGTPYNLVLESIKRKGDQLDRHPVGIPRRYYPFSSHTNSTLTLKTVSRIHTFECVYACDSFGV